MQSKKIGYNLVFLVLVFAATLYGVFHGEDRERLGKALRSVQLVRLLPALGCVVLFIWGESLIIHYMMGTLKIRMRRWTCFLISSVGFFFSCITPSASGGQPAQVYFLKKEKVPIAVSTLVLLIVTITYKLVLVATGGFLLLFDRSFISAYLRDVRGVFYLGLGLNVICVAVMLLLVFHPRLAQDILEAVFHLLEKLHLIRQKEAWKEKIRRSMDQYSRAAAYLKEHRSVIRNVFGITVLQRFALFCVTYFVYRAFGLSGTSAGVIVMLQAAISVAVDMLPLPGGMGISEKLFLMIFFPVFGEKFLLPGMILSRGLGYYTELILSAILTVVAKFAIGKREEKKNVGIL